MEQLEKVSIYVQNVGLPNINVLLRHSRCMNLSLLKWIGIPSLFLVFAGILSLTGGNQRTLEVLGKRKSNVGGGVVLQNVTPHPLTNLDLAKIEIRDSQAFSPAFGDRKAELTLNSKYQKVALAFLKAGNVHEGAIVMSDVKSGHILVWANYVLNGNTRDIVSEATAPSASIFKIVTSTALLTEGVLPTAEQCYSGGAHLIEPSDLVDNTKKDKYCSSLSQALGRSINSVFAKFALKSLTPAKLSETAKQLGWAQNYPFDVPIQESKLEIPTDNLEFARASAGFWHTTLSPFQGVNLASTIANKGEMIRLSIVSSIKNENGEIYKGSSERQVLHRAIPEPIAQTLTEMMESTIDSGTSFKSFHDRNGKTFFPAISIAGKTGTLTKPAPEGTFYTLFVGFAPSKNPEVAISVLVANKAKWKTKATYLASDMLRVYFADKGRPGIKAPGDVKKRGKKNKKNSSK